MDDRAPSVGAWLFWGVVAAILLYRCATMKAPTGPAKPYDENAGAVGACEIFIEQRMHDPGSVDWVDSATWPVTRLANDDRAVVATFRGKNAFNALRLNTWRCVVRAAGDKWHLVTLTRLP